jgi:Tol biopolymer transport system component
VAASRRLAVALALAGCGRVKFELHDDAGADAGVDAAVDASCTFTAWSTPRELSELNSTADEFGPWISEDRLEIVYSSASVLYRARRASDTAMFGPGMMIPVPVGGGVDDPFQSDDGLSLYYEHTPDIAMHFDLQLATRPDTTSEFSLQRALDELNSTSGDSAAAVTADELTIYFTSDRDSNMHMYRATRSSRGALFDPPAPIAELNATSFSCCPSPSADGSRMVYATDQLTPTKITLVQSQLVGGTYTAPVLLDPMFSSNGDEVDPTLTRDGRTLVFTSNRTGGTGNYDLYLSQRECL